MLKMPRQASPTTAIQMDSWSKCVDNFWSDSNKILFGRYKNKFKGSIFHILANY